MTPREFDENLLTDEAYEEWEEYCLLYADTSCYCSATSMPPCSFCEGAGSHPGNPDSLMEYDNAWNQAMLLLLPNA